MGECFISISVSEFPTLFRLRLSWIEEQAKVVGLRWTLNPQSQPSLTVGTVQHCVQNQYLVLYLGVDSGGRIRVTAKERKNERQNERT